MGDDGGLGMLAEVFLFLVFLVALCVGFATILNFLFIHIRFV